MSNICTKCNTGITSTDYNYDEEKSICSACLLSSLRYQMVEAEEVINMLTEEGRDGKKALNLAFEYLKKYE